MNCNSSKPQHWQLASRIFALLLGLSATALLAADVQPPLSVPVKVLPVRAADPEPSMQPMIAQPIPPQPTLPGGKLPQYQLGREHRNLPTSDQINDPTLRYILALPTAPILVEFNITIDGQPYLMARETRIKQILEAVKQPAKVETPTTAAQAVETQTPAEAAARINESSDEASEASDDTAAATKAEQDSENAKVDSSAENDPDSDESLETEEEPEEAEEETAPVIPPTENSFSLATSAEEYLRRYIAATGVPATADEVRWLLTNLIDGPTILMLNDNFQRFRANQRPAFHVLDQDRDGVISKAELDRSVESFEECDFNHDDVVDYTEIAKVADDPRLKKAQPAGPGKYFFQLPDESNAKSEFRRLSDRYAADAMRRLDANSDGQFDPDELQRMRKSAPDLKVLLSFHSVDPTQSTVSLTTDSVKLADSFKQAVTEGSTIALPLGGTLVSFTAVQSNASATTDQISIGAVNDGYPILPVIDPNDDGRFTIRERRELVQRLLSFDRDSDQSLSEAETRSTIRVCVGLGAQVHRELAGIRSVNPRTSTVITGPEWFARMDRNKDNDLSRSEFPGTDEQFAELDQDHDELISGAEATAFDKQQKTENDDAASKATSPSKSTKITSVESE